MRGGGDRATFVSALLAWKVFLQFDLAAAGFQFEQQVAVGRFAGHQLPRGGGWHQRRARADGRDCGFCRGVCLVGDQRSREKEFYILLLVMAGGILGAFASLDLFFFYFFHELALVPTFIMIGVWGRGERKNYATFQITLYLSIGALIALVGLIALYVQSGAHTFDIPDDDAASVRPIPCSRGQHSSSFSRCCCSGLESWSRSGHSTPGRRWAMAPRLRPRRCCTPAC